MPSEISPTRHSQDLAQARLARDRLAPYLVTTPLLRSQLLEKELGFPVYLKLETQQPTGAFKVRAAFNGILSQLEACRSQGVLTTSSGNYAQAVAYAARQLGVKATIVMTDDTAPIKVERTRALGGEVIFCGTTFESRFEKLKELEKERGGVVLHGFNDEATLWGNGTLALELMEQIQGPITAVVCVSGGGLIGGIASVLKQSNAQHRIFGVQPAAGGAMADSYAARSPVSTGKVVTLADALTASRPGDRTLDYALRFVDGFAKVTESEIRAATDFLVQEHKLVVEPGGAVAVAALRAGKIPLTADHSVVCTLSGGNIDLEQFYQR